MALFLRGSGRVRRALKEDPVTCDDTQSQEDILEAVGTVAAAVLADASPLRRAGQGEGVSIVYDPLTGEILSEEEYALWHEPL